MAKIVIVENDTDIAPLLEALLQLEGHTTVLVADPRQAREVAAREQPDLLYLDVRLTETMSGFDVLELVRQDLPDLPVLMCSGLDVEHQCLSAGANAFMLKPFDFGDLLDGIKRATEDQDQ